MAFTNANGESISYECSELIEQLKADIEEYGGDKLVTATTIEKEGVTVYTDYQLNPSGTMTAAALLELLIVQNRIF